MTDLEDHEFDQRILSGNCSNGGNDCLNVKNEPSDADLEDQTEIKLEMETVDNETQFKVDFKLKLEPYDPLFIACDKFKVSFSPSDSCGEFNNFGQSLMIRNIKTENPLASSTDQPLPSDKIGTSTHSTTLFPCVEGTVLIKENCCLAPSLVLVKRIDSPQSSISKGEPKNVSIDDSLKNHCTEISKFSCSKNFTKPAYSEDCVSEINLYKCEFCEKSFQLTKSLQRHKLAKHSSEFQDEYACDYCKKICPSKTAVKSHIYSSHLAHRSRSWVCKICRYVFTDPSNLNRHLRKAHQQLPKCYRKPLSTVKPQCEVCGCSFASNSSKKVHYERFHIDNPQPEISKRRYVLNQKLLAMNVPLHKCKICGALFKQKGHYNRHKETHTGIKYKCHLCDKKYSGKSDVRKHIKRVHS